MKILSIGNSFSQDAQRYLKGVASEIDPQIYNANLYIGGCSLVRHFNNIKSDSKDYLLEIGGVSTEKYVSIKEALLSNNWDVVTVQEVSTRSDDYYNFEPYLNEIIKYVRSLCPNAKIALHETWGYESHTHRIKNQGYETQGEMFCAIENAYTKAAKATSAEIIIPSGKTLQTLSDLGYNVHRDGAHASYGLGRYALALTWLKALYGVPATGNAFADFEENIGEDEIHAIWSAVDKP